MLQKISLKSRKKTGLAQRSNFLLHQINKSNNNNNNNNNYYYYYYYYYYCTF